MANSQFSTMVVPFYTSIWHVASSTFKTINFSHISKCTEESYVTFNFISLILKMLSIMYLLTNIFWGIFFYILSISLVFLSFYHELVVIFDILWIKCLYSTFSPPSLWLCISFLNFFLMRKNFDEISFFALFFYI